jgi:hypothetical protein
MIKESLWKNADVAAALRAAQAWRQAINVSQHWEIKDGKKLMDFYKSSMRGWAKHAVLLQKLSPKE